jgi:hypothetical protein
VSSGSRKIWYFYRPPSTTPDTIFAYTLFPPFQITHAAFSPNLKLLVKFHSTKPLTLLGQAEPEAVLSLPSQSQKFHNSISAYRLTHL